SAPAPAPAAQPPAAAAPAPTPAEPRDPSTVTLAQMRDAWPEVLQRLESISRTSWMIASVATPVAFSETGVLTLSFQSQSDVLQFKKLNAGKGPSEDLRGAILSVLGVRVKYVARHDSDPGGGPAPGGPPAPQPGGQSGGAPRQHPAGDHRQSAPAPSSQPAPGGQRAAGAPSASAGARPAASASPSGSASSAGPVTEWAVAPIPQGDPAPQFAVDDEPEDAVAAPVRTLTAPHDGDVDPYPEPLPPIDEEDRDYPPPPVDDYAPLPPRAPVAVERPMTTAPATTGPAPASPEAAVAAPAPSNGRSNAAPARGGIERYGEAVVRQMLGATFVREEPFTSPTRFG
ncbi:hypothetical protein ACW5QP_01210, partial [Microbacterium arborescens]